MRSITATLINLFHVCHRELWLHANEIRMEYNSEVVAEGKLVSETTYKQRPDKWTELLLDGVKIDFYDPKTGIVHEVKKSDKMPESQIAQVKYYLYVLHKNGIKYSHGLIEVPNQREVIRVDLTDDDLLAMPELEKKIQCIINAPHCPPVINKPFCKQCSFYDFCYVDELDPL